MGMALGTSSIMIKLIERLESLTAGKGYVYIKNRAWTTAGYKVKREDLKDLYEQYTFTYKG